MGDMRPTGHTYLDIYDWGHVMHGEDANRSGGAFGLHQDAWRRIFLDMVWFGHNYFGIDLYMSGISRLVYVFNASDLCPSKCVCLASILWMIMTSFAAVGQPVDRCSSKIPFVPLSACQSSRFPTLVRWTAETDPGCLLAKRSDWLDWPTPARASKSSTRSLVFRSWPRSWVSAGHRQSRPRPSRARPENPSAALSFTSCH